MYVFKCLEPLQGGRLPPCEAWQKWVKRYGNAKGTNQQTNKIYTVIIYIAVIALFIIIVIIIIVLYFVVLLTLQLAFRLVSLHLNQQELNYYYYYYYYYY
jgi:hypothetical protein